ncbi:TetR/AcrR family transcriptional regulator [Candidatus Vondammii sp. HM_W22]|uniref:TetR/AcrR family transcriptional regulator n=1 Tax=Candidatus Vondammii sp. HM_W22 TaxID=2687299 RepID=UPI001F1343E6|nr:TetR/AcrR family transcriptional regulator [Candidatus Vondammii sp. HM_W22]
MIQAEQSSPPSELSPGAQGILKIAEALFAEKGFDAVSLNQIAMHAQVSKANIFHHFKSKEALYLSVLKGACTRSAAALDVGKTRSTDNPLEQMEQFYLSHLQTILSESLSTQLIQRELMENSEQRGKQLAEEVFADTFSKVVSLVNRAKAKGMVREEIDPSLLAFLLLGSSGIFFEMRSVLKHLPDVHFAESPEDYSAAVIDILKNGFK